tara:strand:+ start:421 stop:789 length:369 start_codon:yes stop_codon:yes gene_type:complete
MKEIQDVLPGFDYEKLSQEQKEAVDEVFRVLSEKYSTLDLTPLRIKFKLEEKKYYDLEDSNFAKRCENNKIVLDTQGWIKEGLGEDAIHYPLVTMSGDIRQFEKLFNQYKEEIADLMNIPKV